MKRRLLFLFFFLVKPVEGGEQSPFVWIVEKEGKVSYILGTIHVGVSLEEMPCSSKILSQIQNSDLLFLEYTFVDNTERLSKEEVRTIFIGSKEEQEEILSRMSPEFQENIRERKIALDNVLRSRYRFHVQSDVTEGAFSELSSESQEFLIKYGVDPEGSHADFFHFIRFIVYNEAYSSFSSLDDQIEEIAFSQSVTIKTLDDNKQVNEDIHSQAPSGKPLELVDYTTIEQLIERIAISVYLRGRRMLRFVQVYKSYDIDRFKDAFREESDESAIEEVLLRNRNELWLQKFMKAQAEYENIFLAAGVRHFIGSYNLLDMLEDNGFSIERMTCSPPFDVMLKNTLDSFVK